LSRLLLVRHGNTTINNAVRFLGKTDVELSDVGIKQAEQLRDRLAEQKIDVAYVSNQRRARLTADIINSRQHLALTTCLELAEIDFGQVEGLTFEEIKQLHPGLARVLSDWNALPKFPGGESFDELNARLQSFLKRLEAHRPEETILIVAHAGSLRLIICNLVGIEMKHWRQIQLNHASLSVIETHPQGAIINSLNDVSHLKIQEVT
jgi:alpha-ribazole phosphatase